MAAKFNNAMPGMSSMMFILVVANDYPIKFLFRTSGCFGLALAYHTAQVHDEHEPRKDREHKFNAYQNGVDRLDR
jgi:hypothetical protein